MDTVGVIGVGKLGLCMALILEKVGYTVKGYDNNAAYRNLLRNKTLMSIEPQLVDYLLVSKNLTIEDTLDNIYNLPVIFVVVNTPSLPSGAYDHSAIDDIVNRLIELNEGSGFGSGFGSGYSSKLLVISCTTMPTYCDTVRARLAKYGYSVLYNPEFIAQGDIIKGLINPDTVLIGGEANACTQLKSIYNKFLENTPEFHCMSCTEAEITKISINCFLTTKIAFANTIGDIVLQSGGNPDTVLNAIGSDTRVGKKFLRWGHGFGGPCLPRDNRSLCCYATSIDITNPIGEATDPSNDLHLKYLVNFVRGLNPTNKPVLLDGVVYKKNTLIIEESQQLRLALALVDAGFRVVICEQVSVIELLERFHPGKFTFVDTLENKNDMYLDLRKYNL